MSQGDLSLPMILYAFFQGEFKKANFTKLMTFLEGEFNTQKSSLSFLLLLSFLNVILICFDNLFSR